MRCDSMRLHRRGSTTVPASRQFAGFGFRHCVGTPAAIGVTGIGRLERLRNIRIGTAAPWRPL